MKRTTSVLDNLWLIVVSSSGLSSTVSRNENITDVSKELAALLSVETSAVLLFFDTVLISQDGVMNSDDLDNLKRHVTYEWICVTMILHR